METTITDTYQEYIEDKDPLFYLFCITEKKEGLILPEADFPLNLWESPAFNAIYCTVPTNLYSQEKLLEKIQDWEWLAEQAKKHEIIISAFLKQSTVIPFKFGTIFKTFENLELLLTENQEIFISQLEKIHNKEEWDLKVFFSEFEGNSLLQDNPSIVALDKEIAQSGAGKRYMLNRKRQQLVEDLKVDAINQVVQSIYQKIQDKSCEAKIIQNNFIDKKANDKSLVFSGVFLVDKETETDFHDTIELISEEIEKKGVFIQYSGPWAPYHFVENKETDNE